ncbi:MAG: hypothetical protein IT370_33780 [Deltaproteobacteria bacterium]|nr:hypothetical protein [Deltaproteobacteria bacterium]
MAEKKESSVLFSLRELRNLEDDRVKSEAEAAAAREAAEKQAKADAERSAREAEEAKLRAEQERVRAEQERKEALEREERIRVQEAERKAQVEAQMQLEQQRLHHEHEQALAAAPKRSHKVLYAIVASMVVLVIVLGVVFYQNKQKTDRERRQSAAILAALQKQLSDADAESKAVNDRIKVLTDRLAAASTPEERDAIGADIAKETKKSEGISRKRKVLGEKLKNPKGLSTKDLEVGSGAMDGVTGQ